MIVITGYRQGGRCSHCSRPLRHVITTDAGDFGAACLASRQAITGIHRRDASNMIDMAKLARFPTQWGRQGITPDIFRVAENEDEIPAWMKR